MAKTRDRVLQIAQELFSRDGYGRTSMQKIADELGTTKAALYYHFRSKDEILLELTTPMLDAFDSAIASAGELTDPPDRSRELISRYADVSIEYRATIRVFAQDLSFLASNAEVSVRFIAIIRNANAVLNGGSTELADRVRAAQAIGGIGDSIAMFPDADAAELKELVVGNALRLYSRD